MKSDIASLTSDSSRYRHGTRARYSTGRCRCFACRRANAAYEAQRTRDPLVPADEVRAHLLELSAQGVGSRSVADACDLSRNVITRIVRGRRDKVRRSVAEKILQVDHQAIADGGLVPAAATQRMLREILAMGFRRTTVAVHLGSIARVPALQIRAGRVRAKTELRVRRLYDAIMAGEGDSVIEVDNSPRARILRALRFFDSVTAEDLFDAMDLSEEERHSAFMQALHRAAKDGEVERLGAHKPFRYRLAKQDSAQADLAREAA